MAVKLFCETAAVFVCPPTRFLNLSRFNISSNFLRRCIRHASRKQKYTSNLKLFLDWKEKVILNPLKCQTIHLCVCVCGWMDALGPTAFASWASSCRPTISEPAAALLPLTGLTCCDAWRPVASSTQAGCPLLMVIRRLCCSAHTRLWFTLNWKQVCACVRVGVSHF